MTLFIERLSLAHNRRDFISGDPKLDDWFRKHAKQADQRHGSARVFVLVDDTVDQGTRPLGFYALVGHSVHFDDTPASLTKGMPPFHPIGAVLLAQLAVDERYKKRRLGEMLLADVVRTVIQADEHVATPLLVVDAIDDKAAEFYLKYGFEPFPVEPLRLGARLKDIRLSFGIVPSQSG